MTTSTLVVGWLVRGRRQGRQIFTCRGSVGQFARPGLRRRDVEAAFWVALDWGTYRTLTEHAGLGTTGYEAWLRRYYRLVFIRQ